MPSNAPAIILFSRRVISRARTAPGFRLPLPVLLAGAEGFEPPLAVLETAGLPLNLRPWVRQLPVYLISLCTWCLRHLGQNFFISSRSVVVFLFLVLE